MREMTILAALAAVILSTGVARAADPVCGDVNGSGTVSTGDALAVLKFGVGQQVALQCAPPSLVLQTRQSNCWDPADLAEPIEAV